MKKDTIDRLAKGAFPSYTPEELERTAKGVAIGAKNHREINRRPDEWYEERDRRRAENAPHVSAFCEGVKRWITDGGKVHVEKTYQQIVDDTLQKLINALADDKEQCDKFFAAIEKIREQNEQLRSLGV